MTRLAIAFVVSVLMLAGCASAPNAVSPPRAAAPVILVSIDGFRPDYLDRGLTPNLSRLAREGARGAMRPSFPSKTFPNHYTLVTGLRPDRHGMVDNTMEDPQIPGVVFRLADRTTVQDPRWWAGVPIWVSAERAGIRTAPIYWPGSETQIAGVRPTFWKAFDQAQPGAGRVDDVLARLDEPADRRPGFLTLYFDIVDTAGHRHGPTSPQLNAAVGQVDADIGRLLSGLADRGVAANLVVVSDHGMAAVSADQVIVLDDLLPDGAARTLALGAFMTVVPNPGRERQVEAVLLARHPHMTCWRKADIPARFHYGRHRRVPPIFCLPETGWSISTRAWLKSNPPSGGNHGYDPYAPEMRAVFIAAGPNFRSGVNLADFDNVDVYPLLAKLLALTPEPNDGDLDQVGRALAK